jgi:1-deoxy-D-xylulose-5-phosphate reductoisomerase
LTFPDRLNNCLEPLDLRRISELTFEEPDLDRFPCLDLAYAAISAGGTMPAVLNAANEISVQAFLDGKIRLSDIATINSGVMEEHVISAADSLETILNADEWARSRAIMFVEGSALAA